jgi:hypothetical protein
MRALRASVILVFVVTPVWTVDKFIPSRADIVPFICGRRLASYESRL